MSKKDILLTSDGFLELEEELNELKNVKRPEVIKALKEARALGDLSENADYDAARTEQAQVEGRIQELEKIMENAHIIKKASTDKVGLGTTVKELIIDEKIEGVKFKQYAYPDEFIKHGKVEELEKIYGLDSITIKNDILKNI